VGMTMIWPVSPWRRALREDFRFPSTDLGPVEFWALARLMKARLGVDIYDVDTSRERGRGSGGSGRWLKRKELEVGKMLGTAGGGQVGNLPHCRNDVESQYWPPYKRRVKRRVFRKMRSATILEILESR